MKYRIKKLSYFSACLIVSTTILNGAIAIPFSQKAIAQIDQYELAKSTQSIKAQEVTQKFFDSLIAKDFERAREYLSPSLQNYLSATEIQQQWQKVLDNMGAFVQYRRIRALEFSSPPTVLITANFENIISDFVVTLDDNQQITAVDFLWISSIQTRAEEFVDALSREEYGVARSYLASDLKKTVLPETIEQRWLEIIETTGAFKQRSNSEVIENSSGHDVVLVNLEFNQENRSFMILFNPLAEIVGVDFPQSQE